MEQQSLPPRTFRKQTYELEDTVFLGYDDFEEQTIIVAAWFLLVSLISGSGTSKVNVACRNDDASSATTTCQQHKECQVDIIWSQSVVDLLAQVKEQLSQDQMQVIPQQSNGVSATKATQSSHWAEGSLLLFDSHDLDLKHEKNDRSDVATNFHHSLVIVPQFSKRGGVTITAFVDYALLSSTQLQVVLQQHCQLIRSLSSADSNGSLFELDLLGEQEQQLLFEQNATCPTAIEDCVHHIIEKHAKLRPDGQAVCAWDGDFTYCQLISLSSRLAVHLHSLGAAPDASVVMCFEKSKWAAVAMLAVLQAGASIVMIDPNSSPGAVETIVNNSGAIIALTDTGRLPLMQTLVQHSILVNHESIADLPNSLDPLSTQVVPENTAWIVFTSGSTGKPKGAVLSHSAICTGAAANGVVKYMNPNTRTFQFSSFVFDGAIQDYLFTWYHGGCVCIPSERDRTEDLAGIMNKFQVNWTFLTPSVGRLLSPEDVPTLKVLALGGEALSSENVREWVGRVTLLNAYGPAECTVACAVGEFADPNDDARNIGRPVGCLLWICNLESHDQLVPRGCVGELLVEGPMLARGYLGDPQTTAKSFIENPKWALNDRHTRRRFYKTGDLVRQEPDGSLIYLGRRDDQVKLHGQRITLGGVNDFIARDPSVRHSFLAVPQAGLLQESLVCILSLKRRDSPPETAQPMGAVSDTTKLEAQEVIAVLKHRMADKFASYMIPSVWLPVQDLPLSTSSKIDGTKIKRWLEMEYTPEQKASSLTHGTGAISSSSERILQEAWCNVLGIQPHLATRKDSFFDLGGNSLKAMVLATHLRKADIWLSVADVLRHPILEEMAKCMSTASDEIEARKPDISLTGLPLDNIAIECGISPDRIEDIYPAAPIQEALLTLTTKDPEAYLVHRKFSIGEDVNVDRLRMAWLHTCRFNSILRTRLVHSQDHGTVQVVVKDDTWWREQNGSDDKWTFGSPLLRIYLAEGMLQISIHHSLFDGWSMPLILKDVEQAYHQEYLGERPSFKSFISYLSQLDHSKSEAYWISHLSGSSAAMLLSNTDSCLKPTTTFSIHRKMPCSYARPLSGVTPATLATAAWAIVLSKYTGMNDVCFGLITSGRFIPLEGVTDIVGPLVATTPFRTLVDPELPVQAFLEHLQEALVDMIPHVHFGLQRIRDISPELREAAKFNNTLVVHPEDESNESTIMKSADTEDFNVGDYRTYPLNMVCTITKTGFDAEMHFDPDVVSEYQAWSLTNYFEKVLEAMSGCEDGALVKTIAQASVPAPLHLLSTESFAIEQCVHDIISSNAQGQPNVEAICSWDRNLSYAEMDFLSSRLAAKLTSLGVAPGMHVCFSFQKSSLPVIAMLAIMKAGTACVPLDISYPLERIEIVAEKCRPKLIVCSTEQAEKLAQLEGTEILIVDHNMLAQLPDEAEMINAVVKPDDLCYTLFTSGSTGEPKGVMWTHRTLASSSSAHGSALHMSPTSRVFQFSAFMWDISVCETITTLIHGGCICIPSESERLDSTLSAMNNMKGNWAWFTPSFARSIDLTEAKHLETLVLGGEVIGQDNVDRYRDRFRLLTGYGPTECCIAVSVANFSEDDQKKSGNIGAGVGCRLWIVDPNDPHTLVPEGAVGEILIEGPIVGSGYIGEAEKTVEVFVDNLNWAPRGRFYRSGDLGRMNEDRTITFLGRKDDQVKVRGQRLELGEVEHHLLQSPGVQHALAFVPSSTSYQGRLVAVIAVRPRSSEEQEPISLMTVQETQLVQSMHDALMRRLPPFGVPSVWLVVKALPLTAARKLDRVKIRRWALEHLDRSSLSVYDSLGAFGVSVAAPSTREERLLQRAWADVLQRPIEDIGVDQSFLELGGDSIQAIRLVSLLRSHDLALTVSSIFRHAVLKDMALAMSISTHIAEDYTPFSLLPSTLDRDNAVADIARQCGVLPESIQDVYPVTPLQEAVMALDTMHPGAYFAQLVYQAPDNLDLDRLGEAWKTVTETHTILRSRMIHLPQVGTVQVVLDHELSFQLPDILETYLEWDATDMIGLGDPMARLAVDGRSIVLTAHHAAYDGFSLTMIMEDLKQAYEDETAITRPPFRNFVQFLDTYDRKAGEAFWTSCLSGFEPLGFPRAPPPRHQIKSDTSKSLILDLSHIGHYHLPVTVATIAHASWALLLATYADAEDICFGTTLSGRDIAMTDVSHLPGPTLATVPLRHRIDRSSSAITFLQQVQAGTLDVMEHQHLGLQHIKRLNPEACDFGTMFVVFPPSQEEESGGWTLQRDISTGYLDNLSMYPLAVLFHQTEVGADITLNYDSNMFSETQIERLLNSFRHMFSGLRTAKGDTSLREVMQPSPEDLAEIQTWNANPPSPTPGFIHEIISARAQGIPSVTAVCAWDGDFTYGEIDKWSNRISFDLFSKGVRPGMFVAFCGIKSKWTVIVILAILKAKAAFVPFNPDDSIERKRSLVNQCGVKALIVSSALYEGHKDLASLVISLNDTYLRDLPHDGKVSGEPLSPSSRAWMIFTSGSTGVPKAPVISHEAFTTSITSLTKVLNLTNDTRGLQFASHVFDLSVLEMMGPLTVGGCVCIPSDEERMDSLAGAVERMRVNTAMMTPTLLRSLKPEDFSGLQTVILGGEIVGGDIIERWGKKVKLFSIWAPSETTIANTVVRLTEPQQTGELGKAINARCWLVQRNDINTLASIDAPGELLVEGPCVAQGYHNDPERTTATFIKAPKWAQDGSRFYRTGDLARYDDHGNLHFAGRRDGQVKLRGQRLEIDEVEHHLHGNAEVSHAVVMMPKIGALAGNLVAVVSLTQPSEIEPNSSASGMDILQGSEIDSMAQRLETSLSKVLAKHAVPSIFLPVQKMPQTASGKVDRVRIRQWLAEINPIREGRRKETSAPPATDMELQLQKIWCQVLDINPEAIGRDTSFFQLGGDSITAMQAVSICRSAGIGLSVQTIMRSKTIAKIAEKVGHASEVKTNIVGEEEVGKAFGLSRIQEIYANLGAVEHRFNQSMLLRCNACLSLEALRVALTVIVGHHPMLRLRWTRPDPSGPWQQTIVPQTDQDICFFATTSSSDASKDTAIEQAQSYVDVQNGPILAAVLIKSPIGNNLFLTAHHMAIDLVSWRILIQDLELAVQGKPLPQHASLSFPQWLRLHKDHVNALPTEKKKQMAFEIPRVDLDYWGITDKRNMTGDTTARSFALDQSTTKMLMGKANRAFETETIDLLIAAIWLSFAETFKDRPVPAIYNEIHGREPWEASIDVSGTVGWFTALQPLALDLQHGVSLVEIVKAAKDLRKSLSSEEWVAAFNNAAETSEMEGFLGGGPPVEIVLNFAGAFQQLEKSDGLFQLVPNTAHGDHGLRLGRLALFEFGAMISNEQLHVSLTSCKNIHHQARIGQWMAQLENIIPYIATTLSGQEAEFTKSDFPLLKGDQVLLKRLSEEVFPLYTTINVRDAIEDIYPCATIADYFLLQQKATKLTIHNVRWTVKLTASPGKSSLEPDRVISAWQRVVERHAVLRTVFAPIPGPNSQHQQMVLRSVTPKTFQATASSAGEASQKAQSFPIQLYQRHETQHSFGVCSCPTGEVFCRLEMNHAITDGTSMGLLWKELCREYNNEPPKSAAPPYSDFVAFVEKQPLDENTAYWSNYLRNAKPGIIPRGPQPGEELEGYGVADCSSEVNVEALHRLCRDFDVTAPAVLLTAWGLLITSRSSQPSASFVYANSGRETEIVGMQDMIGPVTTGLACWMPLKKYESFISLVCRVQEDHHNHIPYQHFHFGGVTPSLASLANTAVSIQAMTSLLPGPESGIEFEHVHAMDNPSEDFLFTGSYGREEISLLIKYHRSRTTEAWGDGLAEDLGRILGEIVERPKGEYMEFVQELGRKREVY